MQVYDLDAGAKTVIASDSTTIPITLDHPITGMWTDSDNLVTGATVQALRRSTSYSDTLTYFPAGETPTMPDCLRTMDSLIIANPHPYLDAAQMAALRAWVIQGGHLWIMLDQTDPAFAATLLRDYWNVQVVDSVDLAQIDLQRSRLRPGNQRKISISRVRADPGHLPRHGYDLR